MRITITNIGTGASIDVSEYLDDENDIVLTQEAERDAFERTVDDVTIVLSNLNARFSAFFLSVPPSTQWEIEITSAPLVWVGRIERPVKFPLKAEKIEFTAFSLTRTFWDLCKESVIDPIRSGLFNDKQAYDPFTARGVLESMLEHTGRPCRDLGLNVYADPLYADRPVMQDAEYSLDGTMTIERLLMGYAHYYNAQFYVDAETRTLMMVPRAMPIHTDEIDLDAVLLDDVDPELLDSDLKKYDYAEMNFALPVPTQATYEVYNTKRPVGFVNTMISYVITNVVSDGLFVYESGVSAPTNRKMILENGEGLKGSRITVPLGPSGTTSRKIYREGSPHFHLVGEIKNNVDAVFLDEMSNDDLLLQPWVNVKNVATGTVWTRYDEAAGTWLPPIIEYSGRVSKPAGSIYQINIDWRFIRQSDGEASTGNETALALRYFGSESNFDAFSKQWRELFISRRRIKCNVKGTGYRYGQTFRSSHLPGDGTSNKRLYAVNVRNTINRERTALELVTI